MKTLKQFIFEALEPEEINSEVNRLRDGLTKVLGSDFVVQVGISKLGGISLFVNVHGKNPVNNIEQNSPTWANFWMHDLQKVPVSWESDSVHRALKFRKIAAPTVTQATDKLIAWFEKARSTMVDLESGKINRFPKR